MISSSSRLITELIYAINLNDWAVVIPEVTGAVSKEKSSLSAASAKRPSLPWMALINGVVMEVEERYAWRMLVHLHKELRAPEARGNWHTTRVYLCPNRL